MKTKQRVGDILHDVVNALSIMSSHAQYLQNRTDPVAVAEVLSIIRDEADRAAGLIASLPRGLRNMPIPAMDAELPHPGGPSGLRLTEAVQPSAEHWI